MCSRRQASCIPRIEAAREGGKEQRGGNWGAQKRKVKERNCKREKDAWHSVWKMMAIPEGMGDAVCSPPSPNPILAPPLTTSSTPLHYNEASTTQRRKRRSPILSPLFKEQG
ncbi:hypothetical protein Q8A73_009204 [Channa argus]|nr:hypothetical protein Q8A73_009204 [Channa argus]